jgi:hypothetical protein
MEEHQDTQSLIRIGKKNKSKTKKRPADALLLALNERKVGKRCYIRNHQENKREKSRLKRLATCKSALKRGRRRRKCVSPWRRTRTKRGG